CAHVVATLEALELSVIMTAAAPSDYSRPTLLGVEDYVCDLVLILRNVIEGKHRRRSIEVHKYRRSNHHKGEYPFTISTRGAAVFPLDGGMRRQRPLDHRERYSSGSARLD